MNSSIQSINPIFGFSPRNRSVGSTRSSSVASIETTNSSTIHASSRHAVRVLDSLNKIRRCRQLCDVTLIIDDKHVYCHRVVLAACSPYFRAMFTGEMLESHQSEVSIHGLEQEAVEALIHYMYTSVIKIDETNVQAILTTANLMQISEISDVCYTFLKEQLDPANCLGIRAYADAHSCQDLYQAANGYVQQYFSEVIQHNEFLMLPVTQLTELLTSDHLNVAKEEIIFQAVMAWVKYDAKRRRDQLYRVLQCVRLSLISPRYLIGVVSQELLIRNSDKCRDLVDQAKNDLMLPEQDKTDSLTHHTQKFHQFTDIMFVVGGWSDGKANDSVECFDPHVNEWKILANMNKGRCGVGVAVLEESIFAVGGHDGENYLDTVERFDCIRNRWSLDVATTRTSHTSVGVTTLNECIYAIGGQDGVASLDVVERYDPVYNTWYSVVPMRARRLGHGVAVLDGCIYAIGGSDGTCILSTVERLDVRENRWISITPMHTKRKHLNAAVMNGMLYAAGGRDDSKELKTVERYDPRNSAWIPIAPMTVARTGLELISINSQLVALGGFDGETYLRTMELFDAESNQWHELESTMNYPRLGAGADVMRAIKCIHLFS